MSDDYARPIYDHTDHDGDALNIRVLDEGTLHLRGRSVHLDREAVKRLHFALGSWLYPTAPAPDLSTFQEAIRKAAEDAVAAVMPLHLMPGAQTVPVDPSPSCGCHDADGYSIRPVDPEPHDVGHPEPEPLCHRPCPEDVHPATRCTFCGWLWREHTEAPAPRQLVGCECGHRWGLHSKGGCGKYTGALNETRCTCTRTPPSAVAVGCECGHRWGLPSGVSNSSCQCTRTSPSADPKCTCSHREGYPHSQEYGCEMSGCTCKAIS